jgi:hypothetical protein
MPPVEEAPQEIAFYYPGHLWGEPEWIKSLLLFFDGIGLLVPEYKQHEPETIDPILAGPLREKKLLHYLIADKVVDREATRALTKQMGDLLAAGAFDSLDKRGTAFHAISRSRMGYYGDSELAGELFEALKSRGLARESEDNVSVPLHPLVRYLILTLLAQILRSKGSKAGLELSPATDQSEVVHALAEFLNISQLPSAGNVIAFDLQNVTVDLGSVPLDEVLAFRDQYGAEYRKYVRAIRKFARELSLLPAEDRIAALRDRKGELKDISSDLRKKARSAWRRPAAFAFGLVGASWALTSNPFGGLLGLGGLFAKGFDKAPSEAGAFSYLFAANKKFGWRE